MSFELDTWVRPSARTASRVIDDRAVVIVIDQQALHTLNGVGTFLWDRLGHDGRTVGQLIEATVGEYAVERTQAAEDVRAFLEELRRVGAVEIEEAA